MIESLPLAVTRVTTMLGPRHLTNATGFFFERDGRLYVVTSRHVVLDEPSEHHPDRIEIELHVNERNLAETVQFSIPLYREGKSVWREGLDSAGAVDVVAVQLEREAAVVLALGGGFQAYFQQKRDGSIHDERMPVMGEVAKFCRARQSRRCAFG